MTHPWRPRVLSLAILFSSQAAGAQARLGPERADVGNFRGDIWSVWTSPATMTPRDVGTVATTLGAAFVVSRIDSLGYVWLRNHERTFVMRLLTPTREGFAIPLYEYGSGQLMLPTAAALYTAGRLSNSVSLRDAGLGCAAGHLASLGIRQVAFRTIGRARPKVTPKPFTFSFPGSSDWNLESFYSGHISNSMACASMLGHRFHLGLAEPLPYAFSIAIGVGRLADGHHWPSDMLLGGVMGFAVGKAIAERQLHRQDAPVTAAGASGVRRANWQVPVAQWSIVF